MDIFAAESKRLKLQLLNVEDHLNDYYELMLQPGATSFSRRRPHTHIEETRTLILSTMLTDEEPWRRVYAIMLDAGALASDRDSMNKSKMLKMIGVVGTPRESEIAYKVHPDYWGKGYMSEALEMFLDLFWKLEENSMENSLRAFADPENIGSTKILLKAGFQKTKLFVNNYVRSVNLDSGKRSSLQAFHLSRPGTLTVSPDHWLKSEWSGPPTLDEEQHNQLKKSIEEMLWRH